MQKIILLTTFVMICFTGFSQKEKKTLKDTVAVADTIKGTDLLFTYDDFAELDAFIQSKFSIAEIKRYEEIQKVMATLLNRAAERRKKNN